MTEQLLEKKVAQQSVLIVTEDKELYGLLGVTLGRSSFVKIYHAITGEAGIEKAARVKPNYILMDINLHGLSGIDAARLIRKFLPDCKIILLSQYQCDSCPLGL